MRRSELRIPRVFVELPLGRETRVELPPGPARYVAQVLRLRVGDSLILFDGDGRDYPGRLLVVTRGRVQVTIDSPTESEPQAALAVHLGIGVSKGERMDYAIQKAVELGVARLCPLFTKRSVVRLDEARLKKRQEHWRGVVVAACEQSGRQRLPELASATSLERWLTLDHPCPLLLDHRSTMPLHQISAPAGEMTFLVGPEGGLAPEERTQAQGSGFTPVRLGPRVLRTETAPLAALAAAQTLWGDFRD